MKVLATGYYQFETGMEEIWGKYSLEGNYRQDAVIDEVDNIDEVVFFGRILNEGEKGVSGVIINVMAFMEDGSEEIMAYTYSGNQGDYLISFKKPDAAVKKYVIITGNAFIAKEEGQKDRSDKHNS